MASWLTHWLNLQRQAAKAVNTIAQYEWAVEAQLIPAMGRKRLQQLTANDVDDFLAERAAAGAARSTMVRLRCVLVMALDQAVRYDLVGRNVAAVTETPAGPASPGRSLTLEQARTLLTTAHGDRLEAAYVMALMLGLRPGEVLGLAWEDVDLDAGLVRLRQALKTERGKAVIGPLKTAGSRRTLAAPTPVLATLRAHRRRQLEGRIAAGGAWTDNGLVFTTEIGTPIDPANFRRSFSRLAERAGLGHWHPHELRHSTVSLLSAAGVREEDVADLVGHATTRMTHQVYRHQVTPTIDVGRDPMNRLFGAVIDRAASGTVG